MQRERRTRLPSSRHPADVKNDKGDIHPVGP
jgi:hypothetical protein